MGHGGAHNHAQDGDGGVAVALTGQDQLPQGAAPQQDGTPAHQRHTQGGPQVLAVGDGLGQGGQVVGPQDQVADGHRHPDGQEAGEELEVVEQHRVPHPAGHAQAAPLGQHAHHQAGCQGDGPEGPHGAGARLGELQQAGHQEQQPQQDDHDPRQDEALAHPDGVGPAQGEALLQAHHAHQDAGGKADQAGHGGQVTAAQADDHPQGAAQEHQGADHHEHPQHKPAGGGGAGLGPELLGRQGRGRRAHHDADDLRTDVLHIGGAVEPQGAGDVPQEAGDAEAHVPGVAGGGEHQGGDADRHARHQDQPVVTNPVLFSHRYTPYTRLGLLCCHRGSS